MGRGPMKANPATVQIVRCSRTRLCDHLHGLGQPGSPSSAYQNELMGALLRTIARHPVLAFMVIGRGRLTDRADLADYS